MAEFDLQKSANIVIYGLSDRSTPVIDQLLKAGYSILGIISDGHAEDMQYRGLSVWSYEKFCVNVQTESNIVILILLKNIFSHCKVARRLLGNGYDHFIFLPDQSFVIDHARMTNFYNLLLEFRFDELIYVPVTPLGDCKDNRWIQDDGEKFFKIWCPPELVCTDLEGTKYHQKSIAGLIPYLDFMDCYLYRKKTDLTEYYDLQGYQEGTEEFLRYRLDRMKLIDFYEKQFLFEPKYFMDCAPIGQWMKEGGFLLLDGHHRQTYLLRKGYCLLPLRISKEDYQQWSDWSKEVLPENHQSTPKKYRVLLPQMGDRFWESRGLFITFQKLLEQYFREELTFHCLMESDSFGGYFGKQLAPLGVKSVSISTSKDLEEKKKIIYNLFKGEGRILIVVGEEEVEKATMIEEFSKNFDKQVEMIWVPAFTGPEKE